MKIQRGYRSRDVEDARGVAPPRSGGGGGRALKIGGGGGALVVIIALIANALGVNLPISGGGGGSSNVAPQRDPAGEPPQGLPPGAADPDSAVVDLVNQVTDDIQNVFEQQFAREGATYRRAKLRMFREAVDTGCGLSSAQIGPFYCPPDDKAYIDLSFFDDLHRQLGAPGDFAQAYVLAHEFGHHVQNVLGIDEDVRQKGGGNKLSVKQELQADCFAGVWAAHSSKELAIDSEDIEEAMNAARAIGDDRLQKMAGRAVDPRSFTHGTSAQRAKWFRIGRESGQLGACDTFSAKDL